MQSKRHFKNNWSFWISLNFYGQVEREVEIWLRIDRKVSDLYYVLVLSCLSLFVPHNFPVIVQRFVFAFLASGSLIVLLIHNTKTLECCHAFLFLYLFKQGWDGSYLCLAYFLLLSNQMC